jgi:ParB-like chromosome segregation protein Spo0J
MKLHLDINKIRIDGGTQCRVVIDQPTVYTYLEAMKEDARFPVLEAVFDGATYWLTDGFHRYHAYKLLGVKEVEVHFVPGTLRDAQIAALKANGKHGKPLTNEDKRNKVKMALEIEGFDKLTDAEIARHCDVSKPFVAAIRRPEVKEKQKQNVEKHFAEKGNKNETSSNLITGGNKVASSNDGVAPDEEEMRATELAIQADQEAMYKLLESDDALATAHEEIKRLNLRNAQLETRLHGLMNERNEAVKMVKDLQKQWDKLRAK